MKLNNSSDAIKQAIEGGWLDAAYLNGDFSGDLSYQYFEVKSPSGMFHRITAATAFTDPLFWQALGKARGWGEGTREKPFMFGYFDKYDKNKVNLGEILWKHWGKEWFETRLNQEDETKFWSSLP